jgi:hypothetical protein
VDGVDPHSLLLGLVSEEQEATRRQLLAESMVAEPTAYPFLTESLVHLTEQNFPERFAYGVDLILGSAGRPHAQALLAAPQGLDS